MKVGAKYWDTFFGPKWDLTPIVEGHFSLVTKIRVSLLPTTMRLQMCLWRDDGNFNFVENYRKKFNEMNNELEDEEGNSEI